MLTDETRRGGSMRTLALAALAVLATACGDDPTGPQSDDPFDVQQSNDDFAALQAALGANQDLADDLGHVSGALDTMPAAAWTLEDPAATLSSLAATGGEASVGRAFAPTLNSAIGVAAVDGALRSLIPADLLGTTFEWDEVENGYVATERTGAPANGIRFILYDRTTDPLVENGFVDITDESDPSADRLSVHLEKD
ncbi:MAG: hypothetical protein ACODAA_06705, partial [Gemmatimonadota bacterium]